jgi:hypothetical protein
MTTTVRAATAAVAFALAAACGASDGSSGISFEPPPCTDVLNLADSVAGGLQTPGGPEGAGAVQFDAIDSPVPGVAALNWLVAAPVDGQVAVWAATGDATFILGINDHARGVSTWGTAANPGSPVRDGIDRIAGLDEVDQLVACVERQAP